MNQEQRETAFNYAKVATSKYVLPEVALDANIVQDTGFDEVEDGVWVHAWIKVPASAIPGYEMKPAAPAARIMLSPAAAWPFPTMPVKPIRKDASEHPFLNTDSHE